MSAIVMQLPQTSSHLAETKAVISIYSASEALKIIFFYTLPNPVIINFLTTIQIAVNHLFTTINLGLLFQ
jgi:hypothetical protein